MSTAARHSGITFPMRWRVCTPILRTAVPRGFLLVERSGQVPPGELTEIRISGEPLEKEQWLVPDPENYVENFGSNETYQLRDEDNYNIVLIPDTQNTVEFRSDVMDAAIDGLINSADALNVAGVIHLGDVVDDNNDDAQYVTPGTPFHRMPDAGMKLSDADGQP